VSGLGRGRGSGRGERVPTGTKAHAAQSEGLTLMGADAACGG
jgi:hypothetical protein